MNKATFRETVTRRVIDPNTRDRRITLAYMVFAAAMLLHHVYVTVYFPFPENGAIPFRYPWIILAGVSILLGRMWKDPCAWMLLGRLLMKFLRIAIPMPEMIRETQAVYEICIYAFFICYGAGRVLNRKDRKMFISLFCALWTLAMAVYSCIGMYVVLTGTEVSNLGIRPFYLHPSENRLWPVYHPVEGGTLAAVSMAVLLVGFFLTERKWIRALYIPAAVLIFLLNVFCSSRTSYILMAMGIGTPVSMLLYELLLKWKKQGKVFTLLRLGAAFAAFAVLTVALLLAQMKAVPAYNTLRSRGAGMISAAMAEEPEEIPVLTPAEETDEEAGKAPGETETVSEEARKDPSVELSTRGFVTEEGLDGFLTGRYEIWTTVKDALEHFPIFTLIGQGIYDPMDHINSFIRQGNGLPHIYHFHSTFIQTLWESGFPGFLLFTAFFGIFGWNAFRLMRDRSLPLWQRILPLPAALCWLADMVDCTGYCNWGKPPMTILYLFTGLTIAIARENRKNNKGVTHA